MGKKPNVHIHAEVGGMYRLLVGEPGKEPRVDTGWFKNLITDIGMDNIGNGVQGLNYVHVGAGNTAPAFSDTQLASFIASQQGTSSTGGVNNVSGNYYGWYRVTYVFAQGAAAGNLAEVGVSVQAATGQLFSRALILDSGGNPTTVTVLANEILTVIYEYRLYYSELDVNSTIDISGVTYNTVTRPLDVTNAAWWYSYFPSQWSPNNDVWFTMCLNSVGLTPITTGNTSGNWGGSGTSASVSFSRNTYTNGNHYRDANVLLAIGTANFTGGIKAVNWNSGCMGCWQMSFTPSIPKDNTKTLQLVWRYSWARH